MKRHLSSRWLLAIALVAAWLGAVRAAGRSPAVMATAAETYLKSLTPEQRQQASFPVEGDEWTHWHFIPTDMFPRKGLTIKSMTEPQRQLARKLLESAQPARLFDRDLDHGSGRPRRARSGASTDDARRTYDGGIPSDISFRLRNALAAGTWAGASRASCLLHFMVVNGALSPAHHHF